MTEKEDSKSKLVRQRKTDVEKHQVGDYFDKSSDRYYDQVAEVTVIKVFSGDCCVSTQPREMMVTVLGSCIAACIRDPFAGVGGMNHFLLPDSANVTGVSTRYGAYAMEKLINEILKNGGRRERLEVKLFGGGNVIENSAKIGEKNCIFVTEYVKSEGLKVATQDLGGTSPRRVHYYTDTGKVMVRKLKRDEDYANVKKEEVDYQKTINTETTKTADDELELF